VSRQCAPVFAMLLAMGLTAYPATELLSQRQSLKCNVGPVTKTYGSTEWLVYSCDDNHTVVIVAASGNPAMPFVFNFSPSNNGYQLHGEGTGSKEATD